jgi:hypothetical protein
MNQLNTLENAVDNIQSQINEIISLINLSGVVDRYSDIASEFVSPQDKDMVIVLNDETNDDKRTIYIYSTSNQDWQYAGEFNPTVRDFGVNPLNLLTETTNILPEQRVSEDILRKSAFENLDVLSQFEEEYDNLYYKDQIVGDSNSGDMNSQVYDENGNGVVDNSEKLGGQLPDYYANALALNNKVDKIEGKVLSENNFGTTEQNKLNNILLSGANKVEASDINGNILIDNQETVVAIFPEPSGFIIEF